VEKIFAGVVVSLMCRSPISRSDATSQQQRSSRPRRWPCGKQQGKASLPDDTAARVPYDQRSAGRLAGDDDATRESNAGHRRGGYIMVLPRKLHVFQKTPWGTVVLHHKPGLGRTAPAVPFVPARTQK